MKRVLSTVLARSALGVFAWIALAPSSWCSTWIVDAANGPGTNFTDIPSAIAAAAPGDVILVRTGAYYSAITLDRGLTIVGQGDVWVGAYFSGGAIVSAIPAGETAALSNLRVAGGGILVDACAGTVLLQRIKQSRIRVQASVDVRIRDVVGPYPPDLSVVDSRVQVAESSFMGIGGADAGCFPSLPATPGQNALDCTGASRVHLALSTFQGGEGGWDAFALGCPVPGGAGGNAVDSAGPAGGMLELLLFSSLVNYGPGGGDPPHFGPYGKSLVVGPNVTAWTAQTTYPLVQPTLAGGTLINLPDVQPTLELIGAPIPGTLVTLRLQAKPGVAVRLNLGRIPIVQPAAGILVEGLVLKERSFDRGIMPASGVLDTPWLFPPGAPTGKVLIFQAKVTDPVSGLTQKSNSVETIVE